jgi:hypothetical protein
MSEVKEITKLVATINPDTYAKNASEVKSILKKEGFDAAFKKAEFKEGNDSGENHKLIYDSTSETLEPVYFWVLDKTNEFFGGKVEKLIDNFTSSPGSGHFSELMGKATKMQEEAMKLMQTNGALIKSIINIIYDLKEFEIRLKNYEDANSKDKNIAESGLLSLKQIWMDNVDIKKGNGSINALSQQLHFVTLRDAFMNVSSLKSIDNLDLNERVQRILKARFGEFLEWKKRSEVELKKRYSIERTYLKNQVNSLKMYTRWAKPYLKAALDLEQQESSDPGLVKAFNTIVLELTIMGRKSVDFKQEVINRALPSGFENRKLKRDYFSCVLVDFYFRGIPQKAGQHYGFGGRAEVTFRGFSLNAEELQMLKEKLEEYNIKEGLELVSGMTEESLKELQEDLDYYLKKEEESEKPKTKDSGGNPFSALLGLSDKKDNQKKESKEKKDEKITEIKKDDYAESLVRQIALKNAKEMCFNIYDIYKKAHGMASHPNPFG